MSECIDLFVRDRDAAIAQSAGHCQDPLDPLIPQRDPEWSGYDQIIRGDKLNGIFAGDIVEVLRIMFDAVEGESDE